MIPRHTLVSLFSTLSLVAVMAACGGKTTSSVPAQEDSVSAQEDYLGFWVIAGKEKTAEEVLTSGLNPANDMNNVIEFKILDNEIVMVDKRYDDKMNYDSKTGVLTNTPSNAVDFSTRVELNEKKDRLTLRIEFKALESKPNMTVEFKRASVEEFKRASVEGESVKTFNPFM